jgi:hypothetical protein
VNVQADADYPNKFLDGGKKMTWFGGSRMHRDSAIVQRLAGLVSTGSEGVEEQDDTVMLFVRFEKESYVCLGRMAYESSNLDAHPVQFVWNLRDYDRIHKKPYFQRVMKVLG